MRTLASPVVGLGASAGGLKALQQFFAQTPADSGMAFVVVLHLPQQPESQAAEVLQNSTRMCVVQVTGRVAIEPNNVYVIPSTKQLLISDGYLDLSDFVRPLGRRVAIDHFFRMLGDAHASRAACIVLSGVDADGSVGLKHVKERGGISIAQDPREAEYDSMPRNAISTGLVDFVLPAAQIPQKLVEVWRNASRIKIPSVVAAQTDESQHAEDALCDILIALGTHTKQDVTHYNRVTTLRRIERRMQVNAVPSLPTYRDYLRQNMPEAKLLLKDLLLSVTDFFRDSAAFDVLQRDVVPCLFEGKEAKDTIRVWVAGCATGEEAYSVTMQLLDHAASLSQPPEVQVFASDVNEEAVAAAREGFYPASIELDVTPARLRSFFVKEPGGYRINKQTRERILFTVHDLIKDPPFSRLDFIVCRNLLAYLSQDVRERILELFHFALLPGGFLFLGDSESAESRLDLFSATDEQHHIFRSTTVSRGARPLPSLPLKTPAVRSTPHSAEEIDESRRIKYGELHRQLLERFGTPSVLVNSDYDIVYLSEHAGRFLQLTGGEPTVNLLKVVLPELRLELHAALLQAQQQGKNAEVLHIQISRDEQPININLIVHPIRDVIVSSTFFLVLFEEVKAVFRAKDNGHKPCEMEAALHGFEAESQRLKAQLQATVEQYGTTIEELKASNEEMQVMNEELLSASEELETSRKEYQSVNEELQTVNQELKIKVEELSSTNDDLQNLISSTDIATLFLDPNLHIKRYTPPALEIFNLIPADEGRKFTDITHKCDYEDFVADAKKVLGTLRKTEREITSRTGRTYLARLSPYRTTSNQIDGVVVNFVDITERKQMEDELRRARTELEEKVQERTRELREANAELQLEITKRKEVEDERQRLLRRVVKTQEEERQRISRELHDHLGQQLTVLRLGLESLRQPSRLEERIEDLREMVRRLDADVDFLAWELRPSALDDFGLVSAIANFTEDWSKYFETAAEFHATGLTDDRFAPEVEINLYRIVQEALNNVSKHAQASRVDVILERRDGHVVLVIEDNGVGFNAERESVPNAMGKGLGLTGMSERAALVGGTIEIESSPGGGTTIFVHIPLRQAED